MSIIYNVRFQCTGYFSYSHIYFFVLKDNQLKHAFEIVLHLNYFSTPKLRLHDSSINNPRALRAVSYGQ